MPDQIEQLFADLRAETLPTVRPPGTEPLRRAVRRRRAVVSATTAVTALGLAALIAVTRPDGAPEPVAVPSSPTHYSDAELTARITETLRLDDPRYAGLNAVRLAGTPEPGRPVLGGTYDIRTTCYGSGSIEIVVNDTVARVLPCNATGTLWTASVGVPEPQGQLTVRAAPGHDDSGRTSFGYVADLTPDDKARWQETAAEALGPHSDGFAAGGSFFASDGGEGYDHSGVEPGRYRIRAICVGFGTVRLSAGPGTAEVPAGDQQTTVRCSPDGSRSATLTTSASADGLSYSAQPDADAGYRAAVATVLERY
jgi:hypothetical protein